MHISYATIEFVGNRAQIAQMNRVSLSLALHMSGGHRRPAAFIFLQNLRGGSQKKDNEVIGKIALKRIPKEMKSLEDDPPREFRARPLDNNLLDWHFVFVGVEGSDYEKGFYHGQLLLDKDYPIKPSRIIIYTENGRFTTGAPICLSISSYHPELWQASWTIRACINAIRLFMTTEEAGIGKISESSSTRRKLALLSRKGPEAIKSEIGSEWYPQILELHKSLHSSLFDSIGTQ